MSLIHAVSKKHEHVKIFQRPAMDIWRGVFLDPRAWELTRSLARERRADLSSSPCEGEALPVLPHIRHPDNFSGSGASLHHRCCVKCYLVGYNVFVINAGEMNNTSCSPDIFWRNITLRYVKVSAPEFNQPSPPQ